MIFQSRSLGCSILLLVMILGTTSSISKFMVLNSGMLPLDPKDVAMVFYATVENTGQEPQTVQLSMKRCCLETETDAVDCNAMKLQHGFSVRLHPNKTFNLSAYYINKNLFGRNGECELKLMSLSGRIPLTEFKIQFNTTSSHPSFFQSIYSQCNVNILVKVSFGTDRCNDISQGLTLLSLLQGTVTGSNNKDSRNKCDASDQDCQNSECVLDNSGSRSFYNMNKKVCESTPKCLNEKLKMLSPVTNLCRDQYPSSFVLSSLTKEMKEGINDSDVILQKVNPVEPIKVVCVHGKTEANGHCKCDENWISVKFEPQKVDPQKTPYYMCNVRSPEGEITDRTVSTGYAYTILIILVVILLPCCTGVGIMVIYLYQRNQKRKKQSIALLSNDLACDKSRPDKSDDVISEITSRREVKKSSTSRRSFNGQEPTTRSHSSVLNDSETNSNDDHPPSPHDPPSSHHDPPPTPHSSNTNQGNSNPAPGKNASKANQSKINSRKFLHNQPFDFDAHRHPTTASHIYWKKLQSKHTSKANQDNYLQDFQEIPLIDLEHAIYDDYHENSAFRSRSAPVMNLSYSTPELIAVPNSENSTTAFISTSQETHFAIPDQNISNNTRTPDHISYQTFDARVEPSDTDIRASVKKKQELWAKFLQNYSETHPLRQHSEFVIQDSAHNFQQAYQARSLPLMNTTSSTYQRNGNNNSSYEEMPNLLDTRTYTVFKPDQESTISITPPMATAAIRQPFSIPSKVDLDEVEKMLTDAMKSKERIHLTEQNRIQMEQEHFRREGIENYTAAAKKDSRENLNISELERMDSFVLLERLSQENNSYEDTSSGYSTNAASDILIGSPIGRNKFWQKMSAVGNDDVLKSERVNSMSLFDQLNQKAGRHLEISSSDSSDIAIGSPIGRNQFWIQQFTTFPSIPTNDTPNANQEKETNPYQLTAALKEQLRIPREPCNSSTNYLNPNNMVANNSRSGHSNTPLYDLTGGNINERVSTIQQSPSAEDTNSTFR